MAGLFGGFVLLEILAARSQACLALQLTWWISSYMSNYVQFHLPTFRPQRWLTFSRFFASSADEALLVSLDLVPDLGPPEIYDLALGLAVLAGLGYAKVHSGSRVGPGLRLG